MTEQELFFEDFLDVLNAKDTFRTYGLVFNTAISEDAKENLIKNNITEKRNGVRGVSDEVLENQNSFYAVGVFLKSLSELGFRVEETLEEECDFCGTLWVKDTELQISVEFSYGANEVEYSVVYIEKSNSSTEDFLKSIFDEEKPARAGFTNTLNPDSLYDDLDTFMRDFRRSWKRHLDNPNKT